MPTACRLHPGSARGARRRSELRRVVHVHLPARPSRSQRPPTTYENASCSILLFHGGGSPTRAVRASSAPLSLSSWPIPSPPPGKNPSAILHRIHPPPSPTDPQTPPPA